MMRAGVDALPPACRLYVKIHACQPLEMMTALQPSIVENGARRSRRCGQATTHTCTSWGRSREVSKLDEAITCGVFKALMNRVPTQF